MSTPAKPQLTVTQIVDRLNYIKDLADGPGNFAVRTKIDALIADLKKSTG